MQVVPLFSAAEIQARIVELAARLYRDYADSPLCVVWTGAGSARFVDSLTAELAKLGIAPERHDVMARMTRRTAPGAVEVDAFDPAVLDGRDVIVVDDVIDGGAKLEAVLDIVGMAETRSLRTAVLVSRRGGGRDGFEPDYVGFTVDRGWIVGFGMDVGGELGDLDEIGMVVEET